ncbi:exoribonuclease II [Orbaceae bacterium ac157xtp]
MKIMLQNNPLLAQLKQQLHQQTPRTEGVVRLHEKGYGFLDVDNKTSYFIPANLMRKLSHGDKVAGLVITNGDKSTFEPEAILEPALKTFLGKVDFINKSMVIVPQDQPKLTIQCKIASNVEERLKKGDWIKAKLLTHALENEKGNFVAQITDYICEDASPLKLWLLTLAQYNLDASAPLDQPFTLKEHESDRTDLTHIPFFTIDSKETADMDDALSITQDELGDFNLAVAIADPSAYIQPESPLYNEAMQRCFSTYLPNYNVPMLPKSLANNLCSLKEKEKRPALVCKVKISATGEIDYNSSQFIIAWVESKAKLAYSSVADYIEDETPLNLEQQHFANELKLLAKLAEIRTQWRKDNALIFKDNSEFRFVFDANRQLTGIIKENRRTSHKMVEEAMVIANQVLTHTLANDIGYGIFNTHNGFDTKFLEATVKLLNENQIDGFDKETISDFYGYIKLKQILENHPILDYRLRRYQAPADFSFEPKPHYGMGFKAYATWTSPIRKFGDLINQQLIKAQLNGQTSQKPESELAGIMREKRKSQRLAERNISEKLYQIYLEDKISHSFEAEIVDINRGGARVRLTEIGALTFMPFSLMHPERNAIEVKPDEGIINIKDGKSYKLLDIIQVTINEVKKENNSIIVKLV